MAKSSLQAEVTGAKPRQVQEFRTTHWSGVLCAGSESSPGAAEALEKFCRTYWYPLYAHVRRRGFEPIEAQDLTQEFFARLLESRSLATLDRAKGTFRSYLLGALEHFLAKEWRSARTQKRGSGQPVLSLDDDQGEERYAREPAHDLTPERTYERRWAMTVLEQALARLEAECQRTGKGTLFQHLKGVLAGEKSDAGYAAMAAQLSMTEGAVKVAVHRLRQRFGHLVRDEVAETVASPEEIDQEVRYLFSVLT